MHEFRQFFINGNWVDPVDPSDIKVINPADEQVVGVVSAGSRKDVDHAVLAARAAFDSGRTGDRQSRLEMLRSIRAAYERRYEDIVNAIVTELGAPVSLARDMQAATGLLHIDVCIQILENFEFSEDRGSTRILYEPVGVCGFITPWNWPINQVACKVIPALAAGCTVVLKPSEFTPISAVLFAEVLADAGVPAGVFNLVNGDGPTVGHAIAAHPLVDMVSITGSTRSGIAVAEAAAGSVKRVAQELGGKSPNIMLADADATEFARVGVEWVLMNTGQSCSAPTRMLVPEDRQDEVASLVATEMAKARPGDPASEQTTMGPVVNARQWRRIQDLIQAGLDEGATLVCGGRGKPAGLTAGFYVQPTLFRDVDNAMTIAREEIFGPVLVIIPYRDEEDAIRIANDTDYGLAAYVMSGDLEAARRVAGRLRAGSVYLNGAGIDPMAPFGGYKRSGNGREWGVEGFREFLEIKSVLGFAG
jgi:aldehyde dehydrogenase (NAD+)